MQAFAPDAIRALVFDVFGTVVDWRSSIVREGKMLTAAKGLEVDWPGFADAWRAGYRPAMERASRASTRGPTSTCCIARSSTSCCPASVWSA